MRGSLSRRRRDTRCKLGALYRVLHIYGMTDLANQEVGARLKGEPDRYLVHPYATFHEEICASNLVKIDATADQFPMERHG
jgi:ribulose-5-phosphate 4-epimerase/fuculose-1-phosphate aldolase